MPADPQPDGLFSETPPPADGLYYLKDRETGALYVSRRFPDGQWRQGPSGSDRQVGSRHLFGPRVPSPEQLAAQAAELERLRDEMLTLAEFKKLVNSHVGSLESNLRECRSMLRTVDEYPGFEAFSERFKAMLARQLAALESKGENRSNDGQ